MSDNLCLGLNPNYRLVHILPTMLARSLRPLGSAWPRAVSQTARGMTIVPGNVPGPIDDPEREPRFLEMVKMNFDLAAPLTDIDRGLLETVKGCNSVVRVSFPIRRDDGTIEVSAQAMLKGGT